MSEFGDALRVERTKLKMSQAKFGKVVGVSGPTISDWENDVQKPRGVNLMSLLTHCPSLVKYFRNEANQFRHDAMQTGFDNAADYLNFTRNDNSDDKAEYIGHVDAWDSKTPLDEDDVEVPFYMDVELAAGSGSDIAQENNGYKLRFSKSTLRRCGVDAKSAACVKVSGNSMEPRLYDGDVVGVDTTKKNIIDGKIYAINHDGMLRVKRLYRLPGNGIRVNSLNSAEFPDETYDAQQAQDIHVIGKVFWHSSIWD